LEPLLKEIERWVDELYRLFRGCGLHYIHLLFDGEVFLHNSYGVDYHGGCSAELFGPTLEE
jgi:hypothetical protein